MLEVHGSNGAALLRGVFYGRMSHQDQEDSVPQQREWAEGAARREHVDIAGWFVDEGRTGTNTSRRSDLNGMLAFCRKERDRGQPVEVIVSYNTNRFSRTDSSETMWFIHEFRQCGVHRMLTAQRWIDFRKKEDRALFNLEQDFSNHAYSENLGEVSLRGKIAAAKAGRWTGGRIPYGYRMEYREETVTTARGRRVRKVVPLRLVPDPETAPVVRWLFAAYAAGGHSLRDLAAELDRRGEPTPSARLGAGHQAEHWTVPTVRKILTAEAYLGRLQFGKTRQGKFFVLRGGRPVKVGDAGPALPGDEAGADLDLIVHDGKHDPLTDPATFARVQELLLENRRNTSPRRGGREFVLRGLLRCGHCGRPMVGRTTRGLKRYLCGTYLARGKAACHYNSVREDELLAAVLAEVRARFDADALDRVRQALREVARQADPADDTTGLAGRLLDLERKVGRAAGRIATEEDLDLLPDLREAWRRLRDERDAVGARLEEARREREPRGDPEELIATAEAILTSLAPEVVARHAPAELRQILRSFMAPAELYFTHQANGRGEVCCTFARMAFDWREDSVFAVLAANMSQVSCTCRTVIITAISTPELAG